MRILLTGGAGYVGSAALRWLLDKGHDALAFDDLSAGHAAAVPEGRLVNGSILDVDALVTAMETQRTEAVMHFAALASVPDSIRAPDEYWATNVLGTKNVLDAARSGGVDRFIFSSTAATYSFDEPMPLVEESAQIPQVPYGTTKLAAEKLIHDYACAYDMGYAILRYFNASGADPSGEFGEARQRETHLIPLVLLTALGKREKLQIFGQNLDTRDGTCVRDYVHTDDLAQAHQLAVESLQPGMRRVYNVGSGTGTTVLEVLRSCEEVVGRPIPHEYQEPRPGDPSTLIASPNRIRQQLGWSPRFTTIRQIVETAWEWHCRYPNGYAGR